MIESNGHCPWQVGLPQGWSSSLKNIIIGEVLESIQLNNMVAMSIEVGLSQLRDPVTEMNFVIYQRYHLYKHCTLGENFVQAHLQL